MTAYFIAGNFRGIPKDFSTKFGGVASFGVANASNLQKLHFHHFATVFSLESFPLYGSSLYKHNSFG